MTAKLDLRRGTGWSQKDASAAVLASWRDKKASTVWGFKVGCPVLKRFLKGFADLAVPSLFKIWQMSHNARS